MGCGCGETPKFSDKIDEKTKEKTAQHPCYTAGGHNYARMHIPVAPKCNISCNYCNRKYDCMNESRPGVTSEVLFPDEALDKYKEVKSKISELTVVGIAGPGDALANFPEVEESIKLIKEYDKDVTFCLSTNGLMLPEYADRILALGVKHITITINTINTEVGAKIYKFISYKGKNYTGVEGAKLLLENQLKGLEYMAAKGCLCKVNIVMIKGVNEEYIEETVKRVKELGAFMTNIMPLIPAKGSAFEDMPLVSNMELMAMRKKCSTHLNQMYHCQQCRADAIGKLKEDRSIEFRKTNTTENEKAVQSEKIRIAVASRSGELIDIHFGHAEEFYIYDYIGEEVKFIEKRDVTKYCTGKECDDTNKIDKIIKSIGDCKIVLSTRIGYEPKKKLEKHNIKPVEMYDAISAGIENAVKMSV